MEHVQHRRSGPKSEQVTGTFTGTVRREAMLNNNDIGIGGVYFEAGARSFWHSHAGGQLLVVSEGNGLVVTRDGEVASIRASDMVHAPGGEEHWHGGTLGSSMLHTSITWGEANWLEEVSDEEYQAANDAASRGETRITRR